MDADERGCRCAEQRLPTAVCHGWLAHPCLKPDLSKSILRGAIAAGREPRALRRTDSVPQYVQMSP